MRTSSQTQKGSKTNSLTLPPRLWTTAPRPAIARAASARATQTSSLFRAGTSRLGALISVYILNNRAGAAPGRAPPAALHIYAMHSCRIFDVNILRMRKVPGSCNVRFNRPAARDVHDLVISNVSDLRPTTLTY
ncbi:hypothetical protein EVAR_24708_1 [Eumeta japonica]|uniref:Uncharacterized protein n=1 Tax=Eumeta variegata TaxID=151549 RepID=A0A4C1VD35_EUMVA|nr:hypothetical protein EVAR_24708_1 [Eumeta japonica]